MYALRLPGYVGIFIVWLHQVLYIYSDRLLNLFEQFETVYNLLLPVTFSLLIFVIFNKFLSNIQDEIVRIEKNQPFPNSAALITACKLDDWYRALCF